MRLLKPECLRSEATATGAAPPRRAAASARSEVVRSQAGDEELSTLMLRAGVNFAKRHYVLSSAWVVGLLLLQFGTGFTVSPEAQAQHDAIVATIDTEAHTLAEKHLWKAESEYYNAKGWFWSCDDVCQKKKGKFERAQAKFMKVDGEQKGKLSDANAKLGIMSKQGVQETRDLFWDMFGKGRGFAKRSSWYDLIFMGIGSMGRDEGLASFLLRWLIQVVMNFTIGVCGAFVGFVWYLWSVISSYQPDFLTKVTFFVFAFIAGATVVASFLFALYGAAAGTVYVAVKAAHNSARLQAEERRRVQQGGRAHYE
eukprot:g1371.t1